ncbi:hypothetical protein RICGR_0225 [Rickettsiella grylli]|uniref:Uncharacterized protein n=1 Tax=Rickettsiella grylli TaxID=59196 RepID=A8PKP5_9COXI|nr:hypothetical protein RICGR_0225 [Rickettsiella grylli]
MISVIFHLLFYKNYKQALPTVQASYPCRFGWGLFLTVPVHNTPQD